MRRYEEDNLEDMLKEYGIEDVDFTKDDMDMKILPLPEERPTWMD